MNTNQQPSIAKRCGVLALQGAIDAHLRLLRSINVEPVLVKRPQDLTRIDRIILPGGESTTMLKLLNHSGLFESLKIFLKTNYAWGICAGAILLADQVCSPNQDSLHAIRIRATRNFYGSQLDSFKYELEIPILNIKADVDFIRAPLLEATSDQVQILAHHQQQPVLFKDGKVMACSFHIELGECNRLHQYFCSI